LATADAIAFVGDTLIELLAEGLAGLVSAGNVLLSTPTEFKNFAPQQPSVTIFLYHVGVHGEMRNMPRRALASGAVRRSPLPLELRFLITPWTKDTRDSYRIIGAIAQILYDHAMLGFSELLGNGVWEPDDTVELIMESLPVNDHYDIWDPTNLPYRLSLTYLARLVAIDSIVSSNAPPVGLASFPSLVP
jgi:uncharacterized protein DUF4255